MALRYVKERLLRLRVLKILMCGVNSFGNLFRDNGVGFGSGADMGWGDIKVFFRIS